MYGQSTVRGRPTPSSCVGDEVAERQVAIIDFRIRCTLNVTSYCCLVITEDYDNRDNKDVSLWSGIEAIVWSH
jgi:hypothetical protein